jgi:signal transduction histidine kinase
MLQAARPLATAHLIVLLGFALLVLLPSAGAHAADAFLRLDRAEFIASDAAEPPPDSAAWQPQALPDDWDLSRTGTKGYGWYRLEFEWAPPMPDRPAVYTPLMRNVGAIYLNRTLVGQTAPFGIINTVIGPVLFEFAPALLRAGRNTLHVRLWSPSGWGERLAPIRVGELALLEKAMERERFVRITIAELSGVFSATVGLYMLLIWQQRRREEMYGWFGVAALGIAVWTASHLYIGDLWLDVLSGVAGGSHPMLLFQYGLRFAGWRWPRVERAAWGYTLLLCVVYAHDNSSAEPWFPSDPGFAFAAHFATLLLMLYILVKQPGIESLLLALAHIYSVGTLALFIFTPPLEGIDHGPFHTVPMFVAMGWIVIRRFVRSLNETEALNAGLEQRVAERHADLEREQARLRELARSSAIAEERERLMSDMHEGLGALLMATLARVEQGGATARQVASALREGIDDLRLAIDSLQPADDDLLAVLGNLRWRLERRLKEHGIALDWQVGDMPKLACLSPRNVLHLLRILQEAFNNVMRQGEARRIRVGTAVDAQSVTIEVSDDGQGLRVDAGHALPAGQGLASLRSRANTIGAELRVLPTPHGTTLSLSLPRG